MVDKKQTSSNKSLSKSSTIKPTTGTKTNSTIKSNDKTSAASNSSINVNSLKVQAKSKPSADTATSIHTSTSQTSRANNKNKKSNIAISIIACILVVTLIIGMPIGFKFGNRGEKVIRLLPSQTVSINKPTSKDKVVLGQVEPDDSLLENVFKNEYASTTAVGYYGKVTNSNVERVKADTVKQSEGRASVYPTFGRNLSASAEEKNAIIGESSYLTATGTANAGGGNYRWINESGYLFNGTTSAPEATGRRLYKHTASNGLYHGNVSDDESGVEKVVTIKPRGYNGYSVTGIYAPAGEVIKIQLSEADMNATGGIVVHIGQALYNGQANNIWAGKPMPRMPHLLNTLTISKDTATYDENTGLWTGYVGSFLGGPIYIRNENVAYTATISGGVEYLHFILGYTTKEEFNRIKENCSAPYFDLEVWNYGVLHSGSKIYAQRFSYDELYKAAILWEKVSSVTTTGSSQGIVFLYEPFVAAGAAVAFPGRRSVNCPEGWMSNSLNYNGIVTSGAWGNFHEYHHNFQGYGVGNGGEVTNNAMTLVSYALFTKISSKRGISSFGAQGLGGWNNYTSATWALEETLKIARPNVSPSNGNQGLALYATLLHNFGPDDFIKAKVAGGGQSYAAYMNAWQKVTHNNMYYYFNNILKGTGISNNADSSYPMFVPVSCVYQTGRSYMYDGQKKYIKTMQPYMITHDEPFKIDLSRYNAPNGQYASGSVVIPDGFSYRIKSVTKPAHGSISIDGKYNLTYTPNNNDKSIYSGQIVVTLEITKNDGAFKVDDVDLILEFELSREMNKMTLERTTYTYSVDNMYTDAQTAFEKNFKGYDTVDEKYNHSNPTQNCNTDIWFYPDTEENRTKYPNAPENYFIHDNTIEVIDGKLYFENEGKYRIYLRGRTNCALYYSIDGGTNYQLGAKINDTTAPNKSYLFRDGHPVASVNDSNTYFDLELEANSWVYIKEILIVQTSSSSFIGVGMRQWTQTMFTMVETHYNSSNQEVESEESEDYQYTEIIYNDLNGRPVAVEVNSKDGSTSYYKIVNNVRVESTSEEVSELTESKLIAPTVTENNQPYVNAYRTTYIQEDNSNFESEYFYQRSYNYNYVGEPDVITDNLTQTYVEEQSNYVPWENTSEFAINNLFDGDSSTYIHSGKGEGVSASNPVIITVDLGEAVSANILRLYPSNFSGNHRNAFPKNFKIEGSLDGEEYFEMGKWTNANAPAVYSDLPFYNSFSYTFRYYKITVTATNSGTSRLALAEIKLLNTLILTGNGGNHILPSNENLIYNGEWELKQAYSNFGNVYVGKQNATLTFDIIGTRVGFLTSSAFENNFEVYIDGKKVDSIELKEDNGPYPLTYLCDALTNGKHRVVLKCTGEVAIDSVIIYQ